MISDETQLLVVLFVVYENFRKKIVFGPSNGRFPVGFRRCTHLRIRHAAAFVPVRPRVPRTRRYCFRHPLNIKHLSASGKRSTVLFTKNKARGSRKRLCYKYRSTVVGDRIPRAVYAHSCAISPLHLANTYFRTPDDDHRHGAALHARHRSHRLVRFADVVSSAYILNGFFPIISDAHHVMLNRSRTGKTEIHS